MNLRSKKILTAFVSFMCSICVIVTSVCVYKTGVIKGINPKADAEKERMHVKITKSETLEGLFIDRSGVEITSYSEPGEMALANYPESFSYLIGYNSKRLGTSGLRKTYYNDLFDGKNDNIGASVHLTIDASIQDRLYSLLEGSVGSISVVNAETGEIIALASRGDPEVGYNVNLIDSVHDTDVFYSDIYNSIDEFWYNRAVFAQDPPGSCAKMITATSLVENGKADMIYNDTGYELDKKIHNYGYAVYGNLDLEKALNKSSNTYFASAGLVLGGGRLKKTFDRFMVGEDIALDFTTLRSTFLSNTNSSDFLIASNAYGQGELVMSPLHLAMTAGAIMNEGKMMRPYVVSKIVNDEKTTYTADPNLLSEATDKDTAECVKELLHSNAYYYGFYNHISDDDAYIIAKTGTADVAETDKGNHIYYTVGIEINGVSYGVCVDEVFTQGTSSLLKNKTISTIKILLDELK